MWHLVAIILMIFPIINWPNCVYWLVDAGFLSPPLKFKVTNEEVRKKQDKYFLRRWSEKEGCDGFVVSRESTKHTFQSKRCTGSCGIQEKTWQAKGELEKCGKEGPPKNGINLGRGWSISSRQTLVASTYALVMLNESSQVPLNLHMKHRINATDRHNGQTVS